MPTKSPPWYRKNQPSQSKQYSKGSGLISKFPSFLKEDKDLPFDDNESHFKESNLNFLATDKNVESIYESQKRIIDSFAFFIIVMCFAYGVLTFSNQEYDKRIAIETMRIEQNSKQLDEYQDQIKLGKELSKNSDLYKSILANKRNYAVKVKSLLSSIYPFVEVELFNVNENSFAATVVAADVDGFARMLNAALNDVNNKSLTEISITGAVLNPLTGQYTITLKGEF